MKNKKALVGILALVVIIALMLGVYFATRPEPSQGSKSITVTVVHSDGTTRDFAVHTDESYLGPVLLSQGIASGTEGPYGLVIDTVDGETAVYETDHAYWALYIGDDYATTGADSTPVNDGDTFRLEYTVG